MATGTVPGTMKIIMVMAKHVLAAVAVARGALIWILDKVAGPAK